MGRDLKFLDYEIKRKNIMIDSLNDENDVLSETLSTFGPSLHDHIRRYENAISLNEVLVEKYYLDVRDLKAERAQAQKELEVEAERVQPQQDCPLAKYIEYIDSEIHSISTYIDWLTQTNVALAESDEDRKLRISENEITIKDKELNLANLQLELYQLLEQQANL